MTQVGQQDQDSKVVSGKGRTAANPIILHASSRITAVAQEYEFISVLLGRQGVDWDIATQSLFPADDRRLEVVQVSTPKGEQFALWFDVTAAHGAAAPVVITAGCDKTKSGASLSGPDPRSRLNLQDREVRYWINRARELVIARKTDEQISQKLVAGGCSADLAEGIIAEAKNPSRAAGSTASPKSDFPRWVTLGITGLVLIAWGYRDGFRPFDEGVRPSAAGGILFVTIAAAWAIWIFFRSLFTNDR